MSAVCSCGQGYSLQPPASPHLGRHVAVVEGGVEDTGEADRQDRQQVGRQDAAPAHDTVPGTLVS